MLDYHRQRQGWRRGRTCSLRLTHSLWKGFFINSVKAVWRSHVWFVFATFCRPVQTSKRQRNIWTCLRPEGLWIHSEEERAQKADLKSKTRQPSRDAVVEAPSDSAEGVPAAEKQISRAERAPSESSWFQNGTVWVQHLCCAGGQLLWRRSRQRLGTLEGLLEADVRGATVPGVRGVWRYGESRPRARPSALFLKVYQGLSLTSRLFQTWGEFCSGEAIIGLNWPWQTSHQELRERALAQSVAEERRVSLCTLKAAPLVLMLLWFGSDWGR